MNPFAWILVSLPVFLLVNGKLAAYVKLASKPIEQAEGKK